GRRRELLAHVAARVLALRIVSYCALITSGERGEPWRSARRPYRHVDHARRMASRREKPLEVGVRDDHRRRVGEGMRLHGFGLPQQTIDDELHRVRLVVDKAKEADRA